MRDRTDLARGWLRKAESDAAAMDLALGAGVALDTVCFHAQQAAEKALRAYLAAHNIEFPFTHNLARLLVLCETVDPHFRSLAAAANLPTPFAVVLRYDNDFWPDPAAARRARDAAATVRAFVLDRLPETGLP